MIAGSLEIQLLANLARLQKDMNDAKGIVDKSMRDISSIVNKMKELFAGGFVAAGFTMVAKQAMEAEQAVNRLNAVIVATGNASGFVAEELHGLADAMAEASQFEDEDIRGAIASFLKFGNVHGDVLKKALKLTADYAAFTGTTMSAASETLGKAISSPAQGIERLQRAIGYLNPAQVEAIKNMQEMGDVAGAQAALMQILEQKIGGVAETMNTGYTKAFGDAKKATGEFFETLGASAAVTIPVQTFLQFVTDSMRDMKHIIENGDWLQGLKFVLGFRQDADQLAARKTGGGDPKADPAAAVAAAIEAEKKFQQALADQDAKFIAGALERQKKAGELKMKDFERQQKHRLEWIDKVRQEEVDAINEAIELEEAVAKALAEGTEERRRHIDTIEKEIEAQKFANDTLGMTREQIANLIVSRLEERMAILKASGAMETELAQIQEEIDLRKKLAGAIGDGERGREAMRRGSEDLQAQGRIWQDLAGAAGNFFADLVMNGKSAFDNLREWAKRFLADMISIFARQFVLNIVAGGGGTFSTAVSAAGGAGGLGSYVSGASSLASGASLIGTGIGQTGAVQFMGGLTGAIQGPGLTGAAGMGSSLAPYAGMLGIIGAIIVAGLAAMSWYKSGWRDTNGSFSAGTLARSGGLSGIQGVDNRLLSALGFSDRDAFTMSGGPIISRLFGFSQTRNDAFGVRGTLGMGGVTGENWQDQSQRAGLFSGSDRRWTNVSAFSPEQSEFFGSITKGIADIVGEAARLTGADPSRALAGYSRAFNFQLNENGEPLSDEAMAKLFSDFFGTALQEQVALIFSDAGRGELSEYVKQLKGSGEEITGFVLELLGVMNALDSANILGMDAETLMKFQRDGETLTQTFERVGGSWAQFIDIFYTDAEKIAMVQEDVNKVFADLGIAVPGSNEEFRKLVEGLDLTTESGRKFFTALMGVAPAFNTITNAAQAAVQRFNALAATLSPSFGASNARSVLEARVRTWMGLTPGNGAAGGWDVENTIGNIGTLIREGRIGEALTYAQSLGGNAVTVLNDMLEAYIAWTNAMNNAQGPVTSVGTAVSGLGDAAARAAAQMQGAKDGLWAYLQGLLVNPQLSPLGPSEQLTEARRQFYEQLGLAQGGDLGAAGGLQGYIDRVLNLGREGYGSGSDYIRLFREITSAAADFAKPGGAGDLQRDMYAEQRTGNDLMRDVRQILLDIRDRGTADGENVAGAVENAAVSTAMR